MLSSVLSSVLGELLYIAGPAWMWWVWPLAGKLLLAVVILCRGLGTHRVLRLPVGGLLCLLLALDLFMYFVVRLVIIAVEACSLRRRRERVLEAATDYEAWREAASSLDAYERRDAWRQKPESALYDWRQAQATTLRLRTAREAAKPEVLMALLLPCLKPNAFGVLEGEIYRSARAGTKHAIEEFVDEIAASLGWLAQLDLDLSVPGRAGGQCGQWTKAERAALKAERAAFLAAARLSLGKPALLLSGGGILSVYHFGAVRALLELDMLPQLISGTSGGAVVAAVVATRGDAELRRVLREATERPEQSDLYRELGSDGPLHGSYWWKARRLYLLTRALRTMALLTMAALTMATLTMATLTMATLTMATLTMEGAPAAAPGAALRLTGLCASPAVVHPGADLQGGLRAHRARTQYLVHAAPLARPLGATSHAQPHRHASRRHCLL